MTKIQRDYGGGNLQTAFEYGYSGDGIRQWKKDYDAQKEYRYGGRIDCSGNPLRVYQRALGSPDPWQSWEDYRWQGRSWGYGQKQQVADLAGDLLLMGQQGEPSQMVYRDTNGLDTVVAI